MSTVSNVAGAAKVVAHAVECGLSEPKGICVWEHAPVDIMLGSVEDVQDWANWMRVPLASRTVSSGSVHHNAVGEEMELALNVYFVQKAAIVCPECRNGKHVNCGPALNEATDEIGPCECSHGVEA